MRIITDIFAFCKDAVPRWNTISISGYHIREAGSTAAQEVAFTLANGIAYVQAAIDAGMSVDSFASRLAFFFNAHNNFLEEVAKFRAARRLWAGSSDRFGAKDPRPRRSASTPTPPGSSLTAQQPDNNIVRVTIQALSAVLGGTQSLHTNSRDEALSLPDGGVGANRPPDANTSSPTKAGSRIRSIRWAGSWCVEALTNGIERQAREYIALDPPDGRRHPGRGLRLHPEGDPGRAVPVPAADPAGRSRSWSG